MKSSSSVPELNSGRIRGPTGGMYLLDWEELEVLALQGMANIKQHVDAAGNLDHSSDRRID